jgi:hypothetical protein
LLIVAEYQYSFIKITITPGTTYGRITTQTL